jgi:hypothetical protein
MPKKAAAISPSLEDDVELTQEEQTSLEQQQAEEPPAEQPTPEPEPEQLPQLPGQKPPRGKKHEETVPYERLEALNQRLQQAEQQLGEAQTYRERWARLEERQKQAAEAQQRAIDAEAQARYAALRPNPELDPVGARAWDAEQRAIRAEQGLAQMQQQLQYINQQGQVRDANYEMQNWLAFQVPQARMRFNDYDTRVDFARAARASWWASVFQLPDGRQVQLFTPEVAREITAREELVLLQRAKELGIPVADAVVRLSDTWGYPQWMAQQRNGNGARRAANPQLMPSGNDRLDQIQRGQAVQGLGRVASGETNANLAWQTMPPAEFKTFVGNMSEDQYLLMLQDPRFGKQFERKVGEIDLTDLTA